MSAMSIGNAAVSDIIFNYDPLSMTLENTPERMEAVQTVLSGLGYDYTIEEIEAEYHSRLGC